MDNTEKDKNENPFKGLESDQQPASHIKDKVMASVNFSNMLVDITELFTSNMASSVTGLFKIKVPNGEDKDQNDSHQNDNNE